MISAVLLAAGESRRMGEFKQLLRLGDKTFVEHCVDYLLASPVGEVIVVTGHREAEVRRAVGERPVRFAYNDDYQSGMTSSIKCGVRALSENAQAFIIALVDQPNIASDTVLRLIEAHEAKGAKIAIPVHQGRNGHPILLGTRLKEEVLNIDPAHGLREIVHAHADEIVRIEVAGREVLEDCDLPDDYQRLLNR